MQALVLSVTCHALLYVLIAIVQLRGYKTSNNSLPLYWGQSLFNDRQGLVPRDLFLTNQKGPDSSSGGQLFLRIMLIHH